MNSNELTVNGSSYSAWLAEELADRAASAAAFRARAEAERIAGPVGDLSEFGAAWGDDELAELGFSDSRSQMVCAL